MDVDKLKDIAKKYMDGNASKEEEQLLHEYYEQVNNEEAETVITTHNVTTDQVGAEILSTLKEKIAFKKPVAIPARHTIWRRVAVAASVILMLAIATYFLFFDTAKEQSQPTIAVLPANDLIPGIDGAILTRADGTQITLDNAENGIIAKEKNTNIVKQGNILSYTSTGQSELAQVTYNTLSTPKGRQFQLMLADGTKVWLNAGSSITYPTRFSGKDRKVQVTGEAYFEVAHNASMPFKVSKGEMEVMVLGTHFNVNTYDDEKDMRVTLLEGSVKVSQHAESILLKPGQQAAVTINHKLQTTNQVDLDQVMAWKNGLFAFNEANITDIMRQVARWYDAEVVYEGNVKQEYFSGAAPRSANASVLLKIMETTNTIKFEVKDGKIIVRPAR